MHPTPAVHVNRGTVRSVPPREFIQEGISQEGISQEGISQEEISQEGISQEEISQEGISQEEISQVVSHQSSDIRHQSGSNQSGKYSVRK
jgi:hypothetical protein